MYLSQSRLRVNCLRIQLFCWKRGCSTQKFEQQKHLNNKEEMKTNRFCSRKRSYKNLQLFNLWIEKWKEMHLKTNFRIEIKSASFWRASRIEMLSFHHYYSQFSFGEMVLMTSTIDFNSQIRWFQVSCRMTVITSLTQFNWNEVVRKWILFSFFKLKVKVLLTSNEWVYQHLE